MTSVTIASPVSSRAAARCLRPSSPMPWKLYGFVRGLNAPPRRPTAPASFIRCAISMICSRPSTEHGPAMTGICLPPMVAPFPSGTTVLPGRPSRLARLYGLRIGTTRSTASIASKADWSLNRSSPTTATTVRSSPTITLSLSPMSRTCWMTASTDCFAAPCFMITITAHLPETKPAPGLGVPGPVKSSILLDARSGRSVVAGKIAGPPKPEPERAGRHGRHFIRVAARVKSAGVGRSQDAGRPARRCRG